MPDKSRKNKPEQQKNKNNKNIINAVNRLSKKIINNELWKIFYIYLTFLCLLKNQVQQ